MEDLNYSLDIIPKHLFLNNSIAIKKFYGVMCNKIYIQKKMKGTWKLRNNTDSKGRKFPQLSSSNAEVPGYKVQKENMVNLPGAPSLKESSLILDKRSRFCCFVLFCFLALNSRGKIILVDLYIKRHPVRLLFFRKYKSSE